MSRKTARELALHIIFEIDFTGDGWDTVMDRRLDQDTYSSLANEDALYGKSPTKTDREYIRRVVQGVGEHMSELDGYIERYSKKWKFGRISRIVTCMMRLCMFEVLYMPDIPNASSINEAIELIKRYDTPEAAAFANGILGTFVNKEAVD